jgi:hypothetical protein
MSIPRLNLRSYLAVLFALATASAVSAQPPYPATLGTYHPPGTLAPTVVPAPPGTSFYYAPAVPPLAPLVYTQNYSFYTTPTVTYYPPQLSSPIPTFPSSNAYYETNLLAPYSHTSHYQSQAMTPLLYGNTSSKSTSPYYSPLFFRY